MNKYPWVVSIMSSQSPGSQFCVGTLVASKYVLTSAQCVHNKLPSSLHLMIGDHDLTAINETGAEKHLRVSRIVVDEHYRPISKINDIALLELIMDVDLIVYTPACLPASTSEEVTIDQTQMTGWDDTIFPPKLSTVAAQVLNKPQCSDEGFICAGTLNSSLDSRACQVTKIKIK